MKIRPFKGKNFIIWVIVGLYVSINSFFNILPSGLAPDIMFMLIVIYEIIDCVKHKVRIPKRNNKEYILISLFLIIIVGYILVNLFQKKQSAFDTFFTAREMLYLMVFYYFSKKNNYSNEVVKTILILEVVSSILYIVNIILGSPISPFAPYDTYSIQVGSFSLYRDHSLMPNLQYFSCAYLFIKILKKEYVFNKKRDTIYIIVVIFATFLKMFRTRITFLIVCFFLVFFITSSRKKIINKRKFKYGLLVFSIIVSVVVFMPAVRGRFIEAFSSVMKSLSVGQFEAYQGTGVYRLWLLESRINYLSENGQLLFGMGLISSKDNTQYFTSTTENSVMRIAETRVYNSDSVYLTLIPRYGIVGTIIYIGGLLFIGINLMRKKTDFSKAVGIFVICQVLEGISGNGTIAETGPLLIGMLIGLVVSERKSIKQEKNDEDICCCCNI